MEMDEPLDWTAVAQRLDVAGRGARSRLAEALGMDRSQLARTLRKRGVYPDTRQAQTIDRVLSNQPAEAPLRLVASNGGAMRVPEYGYAAATNGDRFALNDGQILDWVDLPMGMQLRGDFFVVRTIGSSMEPRIWAGERKLIQRNVPPGRDQDAVIEFNDGSGVLKTFRKERDGHIFAYQYNPEQEVRYDAASVKALHAVFPL
jgi:phage repressor protein C with HTH and peptisase S24 domain